MCLASLDRVDFGLLCCVWSAVFVTATQFDNYRHNQHELPKNNQHKQFFEKRKSNCVDSATAHSQSTRTDR